MNRTNIKLTFVIGIPLFLWCWWMLESRSLNRRVFIKEDAPDALVVITVAAVLGLFFAWRYVLRGEAALFSGPTLLKTFFGSFLLSALTLWQVPEAWVRWTAQEAITREVEFRIEHPGPPVGRSSHCQAGLRFYDDWLKRSVELCTQDKYILDGFRRGESGFRRVEIEKRVTTHGARFVRYRFIYANGRPHRWIKV